MSTYDKFLGIVGERAKPAGGKTRNTVADGRILSGKEAIQNKLIDGLGEFDDANAKARELGKRRTRKW